METSAEKKLFRYFAIRVAGTIVFRRTVDKLSRVRSVLYKPNTTLKLEQVSYVGGRVIGTMPYTKWLYVGKRQIANNGCTPISRDTYRALRPYIQKGEL